MGQTFSLAAPQRREFIFGTEYSKMLFSGTESSRSCVVDLRYAKGSDEDCMAQRSWSETFARIHYVAARHLGWEEELYLFNKDKEVEADSEGKCNLFSLVRFSGKFRKLDTNIRAPFSSLLAVRTDNYRVLADFQRVIGLSQFYGTKEDAWILRNLTTKSSSFRGFGEVILSHTGWSPSVDSGINYLGLHRGVWAGHTFDITTMKRHQEKAKGGSGRTAARS
ncbi:uncharacterized protein PAC_13803 [Phialocephala subalpina]|uniref:Uncharacterized protein n=1 Tax=Phialocephala subalpina TaxID=576137 RepID=A0A1L7XG23_9HELO|nr:uncharacterized protein PAC_13803 [Phialocephala subalpina]